VTKIAVTGLFTLRIIVPVAIISVPDQAQASILSLVTSLFSAQAAAAGDPLPDTSNSQKMALLEAPVNANVNAGASHDVLTEGSALMADTFSTATDTIAIQLNNEIKTYKVQPGDTVTGIAKKFGISANTIIWANGLSRTAALKAGQTLVVLPISGVQHKVQSGDTLQAIAKKYKGDADEIAAYNDIKNNTLKAGDIIVIPDGELSAGATAIGVAKTTSPIKKLASVAAGVSIAAADEVSDNSGYYIRPIKAGVKTQGIHGNNAVDLADACGTPIYASAEGDVIISKNDGGWNGGYGNYVVVSHDNGSQTLYSHMTATAVDVGVHVTQGQMLGSMGETGKATGCHVHFEIRNGIRNPF
jgi:murein DD-endopeptidase MepM/ murein hydrolase activator NlpD